MITNKRNYYIVWAGEDQTEGYITSRQDEALYAHSSIELDQVEGALTCGVSVMADDFLNYDFDKPYVEFVTIGAVDASTQLQTAIVEDSAIFNPKHSK